MKKSTLRMIFSKHIYFKRTQFQLTQTQLADAVGTSLGWIQKIESGKKLPGFFLAIRLAVFLEIDLNAFLQDFLERSGPQITASQIIRPHSHTAAASFPVNSEATNYV